MSMAGDEVLLSTTTTTAAPASFVHSVILFVPARGNASGPKDIEASPIERQCFMAVLMGTCFCTGLGDASRLSIIMPRAILMQEFDDAADEMQLQTTWQHIKMSSCIILFDDLKTLAGAFRSAGTRHPTGGNGFSSLFIVGHGAWDKILVQFGEATTESGAIKKPTFLMHTKLSGMLNASGTRIIHLMTCKASRLCQTLQSRQGHEYGTMHCEDAIFYGYGANDVTTVPLQFAAGE